MDPVEFNYNLYLQGINVDLWEVQGSPIFHVVVTVVCVCACMRACVCGYV